MWYNTKNFHNKRKPLNNTTASAWMAQPAVPGKRNHEKHITKIIILNELPFAYFLYELEYK